MKTLITLLTMLLLTLNTVLASATMLPTVSAPESQKVSPTMHHCDHPHHKMSDALQSETKTVSTISLCGMDNCDCWHSGVTAIPYDTHTQSTVLLPNTHATTLSVSDTPAPFIPPHQRPPRSLSA